MMTLTLTTKLPTLTTKLPTLTSCLVEPSSFQPLSLVLRLVATWLPTATTTKIMKSMII
jgi:hypothetical protein